MQYLNKKFSIPAPNPPASQFKMLKCGECGERYVQSDGLAPQYDGAWCGMCRGNPGYLITEERTWRNYFLKVLMSG